MSTSVRRAYVRFVAPVNEQSINALFGTVDRIIAEGFTDLTLLISSPGGTVFHGLSAFNYLRGIPLGVETHNLGSVDSVGVTIYVAGSRRLSVPDARFLLHPVSMQFSQGSMEREQVVERLKSFDSDIENIAGAIADALGKPEKEILDAMTARTVLSPKQAVDFGLTHEIKRDLFPRGGSLFSIEASA